MQRRKGVDKHFQGGGRDTLLVFGLDRSNYYCLLSRVSNIPSLSGLNIEIGIRSLCHLALAYPICMNTEGIVVAVPGQGENKTR